MFYVLKIDLKILFGKYWNDYYKWNKNDYIYKMMFKKRAFNNFEIQITFINKTLV